MGGVAGSARVATGGSLEGEDLAVRIMLDESDVITVANAMAKNRRLDIDFETATFGPDTIQDQIYSEALRIVAALRVKTATSNG
jgi:hypothetical protein